MEDTELLTAQERRVTNKHAHTSKLVQEGERDQFDTNAYANARVGGAFDLTEVQNVTRQGLTKQGGGSAQNPAYRYDSQQLGNIQNFTVEMKRKAREIYDGYTSKRTSDVNEVQDGVGRQSLYRVSEKRDKNKMQELVVAMVVLVAIFAVLS
jgi:hypothetical protein